MKAKSVFPLLLSGLLVTTLFSCSDSITDPGDDANLISIDSQDIAGKKGGKGKPGGSSTFPSSSLILVEELPAGLVIHTESFPWFKSFMLLTTTGASSSFSLDSTPAGLGEGTAESFFGCVNFYKPCYKITVKAVNAQPNDLVLVKPFPMVRNQECAVDDNLCARDPSFGDTARRFSLADDYAGTPWIPFSEFVDDEFVFYWQGQKVDRLYNSNGSISEPRNRWTMRVERDPDFLDDVYRFEAVYKKDGSSINDGTSTEEVLYCVKLATSEGTSNCLITYSEVEAFNSFGDIRVEFLNVTSQTTGKGKKKTTSVSLNFNYFVGTDLNPRVNDDTGSDLWTNFRVEWFRGGSSIDKYLDGTGNQGFPIRGSGDCVSVRPLQSYIMNKKSDLDYTASFSAGAHAGWSFDIAENGFLTERGGPLCQVVYP